MAAIHYNRVRNGIFTWSEIRFELEDFQPQHTTARAYYLALMPYVVDENEWEASGQGLHIRELLPLQTHIFTAFAGVSN